MIDTQIYKKYAHEIVHEAGEKLKEYFSSGNFSIREKSHIDLATEADDTIDVFIREKISKEFPSHVILTEESAPENFNGVKSSEYLWVLDPIDGTVNFSRGNPYFAISLALVVKGRVVLGIIYAPILDLCYIGESGKKPTENGKEIIVSRTSKLHHAVLLCDWAWGIEDRENITKKLLRVCANVRGIRSTECFVLATMQLAKGEADVYMTIGQKPWDCAAASLIISEAGGKISNENGEQWDIFSHEFFASNSVLHTDFLNMLQ